MVLEKALESPLDIKERSNQSILREINPEYSFTVRSGFRKTDADGEGGGRGDRDGEHM